ncbi:nitrite/sulfite reductase, partial [Turicibacter sanguinis]|nr:nitrite/sulfite reductase [Turicibacter sanguinis]
PNDVLYHLEAMVNLFKAEGDYENRNKARVRYIVERMGEEAFIEAYQKHLDEAKNKGGLELNITPQEIHKIGCECDVESKRLFAQKQEGLYSVYLHPIGGQLEVADLKKILDYLANIEGVDIRLAMTEGVYFRNLTGKEAKGLLELTESMGGDTPFEHSVACIGIPTCQIGLCNSQGVLKQTMEYFKEKQCKTEVLPAVHFSGCGNSCGVHQISGIGFTGKKKKVGATVEECFTLWIGGKYEVGKTRLGEVFGEIQKTRIPEFLYELALSVEESGLDFESYIKQNEEQLKEITQKYLV